MRKVKITKKGLPSKAHGGPTGGATEGLRRFMEGNKNYDRGMNQFAAPEFEVNKTIKAVDKEEANIEAEGGEYAVVPGMAGIPESYKISGPRHSGGGVPLNLAEDSFIFSDFRDMKIKDKDILADFGFSVPKKGRVKGRTPAEIAKRYELNKYKKVLLDPNSDMLERETAELMIKNFNMKLGKLALVQESKKGFPQEVPAIAMPYLESIQQDPAQFSQQELPSYAYGGGVSGDPSQYAYGKTGGQMARRFPGLDIAQYGGSPDWTAGDTEFLGAFWKSILQGGGTVPPPMSAETKRKLDAAKKKLIDSGAEFGEMTPEMVEQWNIDHPAPAQPLTINDATRIEQTPSNTSLLDQFIQENADIHELRRRHSKVTPFRSFQTAGEVTPEDNLYNYLEQYGATGDILNYGKKPIPLDKTKSYQYTPTVKGRDMDRVMLENQSYKADSVYTQPGFPEDTGVAWVNGKPVVVPTKKGSTTAQDFTDTYGNFRRKGKASPIIYPAYKKPEIASAPSPYEQQEGGAKKSVETVPDFRKMTPGQRSGYNSSMDKFVSTSKGSPEKDAYRELIEKLHANAAYDIKAGTDSVNTYYNPVVSKQEGGANEEVISEDDYTTASDYAASQVVEQEGLTNAPAPEIMTRGQLVMTFGTPEEKRAWLFDNVQSQEDPSKWIARELHEMSWEEIKQFEKEFNGLPWRSIKKEMEREENKANANAQPQVLVNPSTGEVVNDNPSQQEIESYKAVKAKSVGANVETGKTVPHYKLPDDAVIHTEGEKYDEETTKAGEYLMRKDGTLAKISKSKGKLGKASVSGLAGYKPQFGSIEKDVEEAKAIMSAYPDVFKKKGDKWNIAATSDKMRKEMDNLPLEHKVFLTRLFSTTSEKGQLGAPGLKIGTQSSKNAKGGFYGFVDPELIEYQNWKSNNPNGKPEDFEVLSAEEKLDNRKNYLGLMKYTPEEIADLEATGKLASTDALYTNDFLKGTKTTKGLTRRNQEVLQIEGVEDFRPGHQDDLKFGLEHADAYNITRDTLYEEVKPEEQVKGPEAGPEQVYEQSSIDAPWWAQDIGNMMMSIGERASLKKYLPHSFPIDLARPDVVYYDPSRALAANAEQANIAAQATAAFAGPQSTYQLTGIQGQAFQQAANTLADYEAKNVGVANQYLDKVKSTADRSAIMNAQRMKTFYDENVVANQQFDNSKRAANRNVFEAWRQGLTNATKTQTLNTLYPQYNTDPSSGGITHFTDGRPLNEQTPPGSASNDYAAAWKQFQKDNPSEDVRTSYNVFRDSYGKDPVGSRRQRRQADRQDFFNMYNT